MFDTPPPRIMTSGSKRLIALERARANRSSYSAKAVFASASPPAAAAATAWASSAASAFVPKLRESPGPLRKHSIHPVFPQ